MDRGQFCLSGSQNWVSNINSHLVWKGQSLGKKHFQTTLILEFGKRISAYREQRPPWVLLSQGRTRNKFWAGMSLALVLMLQGTVFPVEVYLKPEFIKKRILSLLLPRSSQNLREGPDLAPPADLGYFPLVPVWEGILPATCNLKHRLYVLPGQKRREKSYNLSMWLKLCCLFFKKCQTQGCSFKIDVMGRKQINDFLWNFFIHGKISFCFYRKNETQKPTT